MKGASIPEESAVASRPALDVRSVTSAEGTARRNDCIEIVVSSCCNVSAWLISRRRYFSLSLAVLLDLAFIMMGNILESRSIENHVPVPERNTVIYRI
jgi:hypothetical protein